MPRRHLLTISNLNIASPVTEAYKAAFQFASQPDFAQHCVTRAEYAESGSNASRRKFRDWTGQDSEKEKQQQQQSKEPTKQKEKGKVREDDRPQSALGKQAKARSKVGTASASTRRR